MESNQSYYARRAVQEEKAAMRAMTPTAQAWHRHLAEEFTRKSRQCEQVAASA